jgi:hypothetical protein
MTDPILLPHLVQNLAPARKIAPHDPQRLESAAPHASQNRLSSGVSEWQLGHSMKRPRPGRPLVFQLCRSAAS